MSDFLHPRIGPGLDPGSDRYSGKHEIVDGSRPSPLEWMRTRRLERENRRADAAHQKVAERLGSLGNEWRVLDLQAAAGSERMSFLAVGPGGVFAVTIKDHGRARVNFAGDVVQIDGRRPKYVQEARRNAKVAAEALSRTAGISVPVVPVLAFGGSGVIAVHGMPKGMIVTSYGELSRVLNARGRRLARSTVDKLYSLATNPTTWTNPPYVPLAERYKWYPDGTVSGDKRSADKDSAA